MFYRQTVLDNGVTVLTEHMEGVRSIALGIWLAVGSRDEGAGEAGMSHFMEHMMFKGTPTRSAVEISESFDRLGAELNAFTSKEYTAYYSRFVDENLPQAFETLADMVCNSEFTDAAAKQERKVVLEEIARAQDQPDDSVHEMFSRALFPDSSLGLPILGSKGTVRRFGHDALESYWARHYKANNVFIAAAGNVDHAKLVRLARKHLTLKKAKPRSGPKTRSPRPKQLAAPKLSVATKATEQAHLVYGTTVFGSVNPDRFALAILDGTLGGGMSSRLFQEVREKRGLAYAVYSFQALYQDIGEFGVYVGTRPEKAVEVVKIIQYELERVAADGVSEEEFERVKQAAKGQLALGMEATRNRMTRLGKNATTGSEILTADEIIARLDAVTMEDIERLAGMIARSKHALAVVGPDKATKFKNLLGS